jgi:hypothetical protein
MILDNKTQQEFLLQVIKQVSFPGELLELAYEVKQAILNAEVKE